MEIYQVKENKKRYFSLLLLGDEQESMVDKYLEAGTMFVLDDQGVKGQCVVLDQGQGILEIKNLAVEPAFQGRGYGQALIEFVAERYKDDYTILQVGTGESPLTLGFYQKCGFTVSHRVENFFTDNYNHPIFEDGVQLVHMIYLRRNL